MKIIIFGGGISGLTIAHILIQKGFQIELYESEDNVGGMARSRREPCTNIPTEHSWRGYAPFYRNFYHIAKQIPTQGNETVVDNLSDLIQFFMLGQGEKNKDRLDLKSMIIIGYIIGKSILSDKRSKEQDFEKNLAPFLKKHLSKYSYDYFIKFLMGPGWGMDKDSASLGHYAKFTEFSIFQSVVQGKEGRTTLWKDMAGPTSEMWFDPCKKFLEEKGVVFHLKSSLKYINTVNDKVYNCILVDGKEVLVTNMFFVLTHLI